MRGVGEKEGAGGQGVGRDRPGGQGTQCSRLDFRLDFLGTRRSC